MEKFRFLDWNVYKKAKGLLNIILLIVSRLPKEYRFEIGSQIIRAAFSIVLNIAEGSGKGSDKEMNRYFEIALGSASETLAGVDVLKDNKFIDDNEFKSVYDKIDSIAKQIGGFKKKLDD